MQLSNFDHFGVMIDCSRNSVMSPATLRRFLPILKKMGYNTVLLYTEDTYEVEGEPYFGYMRGRYSIKELQEIDAFAADLGIEMIPCIQTLAHLNGTLRWEQIPTDWDDIMLTDCDRTYEVIDRMFSSLSKAFRSKKIHVGMDEAYMLGRGYHQDEHGPEDSIDIIKRHLKKVEELAMNHGYEQVLLWSDCFFSSWNNRCYYIDKTTVPQHVIDSVSEHTYPVYWDYYNPDQSKYDGMIKNHMQLKDEVWFAGGAWSWIGFAPDNAFTLKGMLPAMRAVRENKVKNVFFTMWGDDGGECSKFTLLASLYHLAQFANGVEDVNEIKKSFYELFGVPYDAFMALDLANKIKGSEKEDFCNPCKYMLFSDYFNDFLDHTVDLENEKIYADNAKKLREYEKIAGDYAYLFDTQASLCEALAVKYGLGKRTRDAYEAGDKETLRRLATEEYPKAKELILKFSEAFRRQWFRDNKASGFDVQDLRIGGIVRRTETCAARILEYVDGKIDSIQEYEEELLPFKGDKGMPIHFGRMKYNCTTNVYSF